MLAKKLLIIGVAAALLVGSGVALGAVRIRLAPNPLSIVPESRASGRAVLNYARGQNKTIVEVNCAGLKPSTEYTVNLSPNNGISFHDIGAFTTLRNGTGTLHVTLPGDQTEHLPMSVNLRSLNVTVLIGP